jgi:hypothetical protein
VGSTPLRGISSKTGLFNDAALVLANTTLYSLDDGAVLTPFAGTIAGGDRADFALGQDALLNSIARIAANGTLYKMSSADGIVAAEVFPYVGAKTGASSVCYHRGFWVAVQAGTQLVYYQVPGDTAWSVLSFASAEYSPDPLVAIRSRGDQIALLGSKTTEIWTLTGQASPALAPYGGLNFDFGCRARDSAVNVDGALIWVDHLCAVRYFQGSNPTIISDNGLSEQIRLADPMELRATYYEKDQHTFYQLTLGPNATWSYDLSTKEWHRDATLNLNYFTPHLMARVGDKVLAADAASNTIFAIDPTAQNDAGAAFPVEFTAFAELLEGTAPCINVELICETGSAPLGVDQEIGMRFSDNNGKTWSGWEYRPLGLTGEYLTRARWNALGQIKAPYGRIFHFRDTTAAGRRYSSLQMNAQ